MLNHAAWLEHENSEIRYEHNKKVKEWRETHEPDDPLVDQFGRSLSELSSAQMNAYLTDWSGFG
jgi:hypothetical protein